MTTITFKEWKKNHKYNSYAKSIKSDAEFQSLRDEFNELTQGGNYECMYELAQMEGCDMDDIRELIA